MRDTAEEIAGLLDDPLIGVVETIVDRSPRVDWMTSAESRAEAERLVTALWWKGLDIRRARTAAWVGAGTGGTHRDRA